MITKSCAASRYRKFNNPQLLKINNLPPPPEMPQKALGLICCQLRSKEGFTLMLTSDGSVLGWEVLLCVGEHLPATFSNCGQTGDVLSKEENQREIQLRKCSDSARSVCRYLRVCIRRWIVAMLSCTTKPARPSQLGNAQFYQ